MTTTDGEVVPTGAEPDKALASIIPTGEAGTRLDRGGKRTVLPGRTLVEIANDIMAHASPPAACKEVMDWIVANSGSAALIQTRAQQLRKNLRAQGATAETLASTHRSDEIAAVRTAAREKETIQVPDHWSSESLMSRLDDYDVKLPATRQAVLDVTAAVCARASELTKLTIKQTEDGEWTVTGYSRSRTQKDRPRRFLSMIEPERACELLLWIQAEIKASPRQLPDPGGNTDVYRNIMARDRLTPSFLRDIGAEHAVRAHSTLNSPTVYMTQLRARALRQEG